MRKIISIDRKSNLLMLMVRTKPSRVARSSRIDERGDERTQEHEEHKPDTIDALPSPVGLTGPIESHKGETAR